MDRNGEVGGGIMILGRYGVRVLYVHLTLLYLVASNLLARYVKIYKPFDVIIYDRTALVTWDYDL